MFGIIICIAIKQGNLLKGFIYDYNFMRDDK